MSLIGREVSFGMCRACADAQHSARSRRHDSVGRSVFLPELQRVATSPALQKVRSEQTQAVIVIYSTAAEFYYRHRKWDINTIHTIPVVASCCGVITADADINNWCSCCDQAIKPDMTPPTESLTITSSHTRYNVGWCDRQCRKVKKLVVD